VRSSTTRSIFFDGYKSDPEYALRTLAAALKGGASNLSLCDTNGGTLVDEFKDIVARIVKEFGAGESRRALSQRQRSRAWP